MHPERFDLSRSPNPHVGFGGGGGTSAWARTWRRAQLRAIFGELLHQLPDIEAGEPSYVAGNFIHAIRSMPCTGDSHRNRRVELVGQQGQQFRAAAVDLDGGHVVAAGGAAVDDGHRHARADGVPHEPIAGEHRQRRPRDQ